MKTLEELTALQQDFLDAGHTAEFGFRMACLTLLKKSLKNEFDKGCKTENKAVDEHAKSEAEAKIKSELLKHLNRQIKALQNLHWKEIFQHLFRRIFQRENQPETLDDLHPAIIPIHEDFTCLYTLIDAISNGQCAILLTTPEAKNMNELIKTIVEDNFTEDFVAVYTPSEVVGEMKP
ncbi:MAG: hypothetical protein IIX64_06255 [Bacteroidales bacterium]|nr:hypothetical protein [Bacteroidales bacterium]